jgi:hypothetical protein
VLEALFGKELLVEDEAGLALLIAGVGVATG